MNNQKIHESVMVREVIDNLHLKNQAKIIDGTLGTGGHTLEILKSGAKVLGIEADPEMLAISRERIGDTATLVNGNFIDIKRIASQNEFLDVDGILLDLGVTNLHLLDKNRGFSFSNSDVDTKLDMRLDSKNQGVKALDLLNMLRLDQLEKLFDVTMDRSSSRWISKQILERRKDKAFETVNDLLDICEALKSDKHSINKATLPFLALRIAVNTELDNLIEVLPKAYNLLKVGGKLLVITFHSGEDKIVKEFRSGSELVLPSSKEIEINPRARSAKLRVITKNE